MSSELGSSVKRTFYKHRFRAADEQRWLTAGRERDQSRIQMGRGGVCDCSVTTNQPETNINSILVRVNTNNALTLSYAELAQARLS